MKLLTEYKFLNGIIPKNWKEEYYETDKYFYCYIRCDQLSVIEWDKFSPKIISIFGKYIYASYVDIVNGVINILIHKKEFIMSERNKKIDIIIN